MSTNEELLQRYCQTGDPLCFRTLVEEFGGMVYAVGLRITADSHAAEDLSQDCFLELARNAATIRSSVAGWLHSAVTSRALNLVRSRQRRTAQAAAAAAPAAPDTTEFSELQPLIDEALSRLEQPLRDVVIDHYLRGETQADIAERLGVNQSTVSRRLTQGLDEVRNHLRNMGVLATVVGVMHVFEQSASAAPPPQMIEMAARVGLAGVGWTAAKSTAGGLGAVPGAVVVGIGHILLALVCSGWLLLLLLAGELALFVFPPNWFRQLVAAWSLGHDPWTQPTFPFRRWNWTVPPREWKGQLAATLYLAFVAGLLALGAPAQNTGLGLTVSFAVLGWLALFQAIRLGGRVWRFRHNRSGAAQTPAVSDTARWEIAATGAVAFVVSIAMTFAVSQSPAEGSSILRNVLMGSTIVATAAVMLWGVILLVGSSGRAAANGNESVCAVNPVAQFAVLLILFSAATLCELLSLLCATVSIILLREPYVRQVPLEIVVAAGIGAICAVVFLCRLRWVRDRLLRIAYTLLCTIGALLVASGLGLATWGAYLAQTMPAPRSSTPTGPIELSPEQQAYQAKLQALTRKYSRELAASVPSTMPAPWRRETEHLAMFPSVQEVPALNVNGVVEQLGLPPEAQLQDVQAMLIQQFSHAEHPTQAVVTYTFVCASSEAARALAKAWGPPVMQKRYLVVVPYTPNAAAPLSDREPLIRAIGRQLASSDLPAASPR